MLRKGQRDQGGQAVVEAAILLPAMIFLLLCTIQLAQLQQARILSEYAVYSAARAGVVMNGDNGSTQGVRDGPMHRAAMIALAPAFGRTDSWTRLGATLASFAAEDKFLAPSLSQVRVQVLNPRKQDFATFGGHLDGKEIDFDDVRPAATNATLLSLQLRYLYEMRVPFANKMIQTIWMASKLSALGAWRGWDWTSPRAGAQKGPDAVAATRAAAPGLVIGDGTPEGIPVAQLVAAGSRGRFFLPVYAWYTMRMQSNPYVQWAAP